MSRNLRFLSYIVNINLFVGAIVEWFDMHAVLGCQVASRLKNKVPGGIRHVLLLGNETAGELL